MKKQAFNPYLPNYEYIPDGEPYVFGDRVYVYGSHDKFNGEDFCLNDYVCWSAPADDLGDWRYEGVIYRKEQDPLHEPELYMYAPDITPGPDGRYYLYYTLGLSGTMAVAVGDSPVGPFAYYGRVQYPGGWVLSTHEGDVYQFDPGVLLDEDGRVWLYTGFGAKSSAEQQDQRFGKRTMDGCYCVELEQDMLTVKAEPALVIPQYLRCPDRRRAQRSVLPGGDCGQYGLPLLYPFLNVISAWAYPRCAHVYFCLFVFIYFCILFN